MGIKVKTETIIKFGNREYVWIPTMQSWRSRDHAFTLKRDGSHYERELAELLDAVLEQHQEDNRVKLEEGKG